jgi:hypothetical protein
LGIVPCKLIWKTSTTGMTGGMTQGKGPEGTGALSSTPVLQKQQQKNPYNYKNKVCMGVIVNSFSSVLICVFLKIIFISIYLLYKGFIVTFPYMYLINY